MKRIVIILIIAFVNIGGLQVQAVNNSCLVLILSGVFLCGQILYSPYITEELNTFDLYSSITILITLFGGIFSYICNDEQTQSVIMIIIFIINLVFILYFLRHYVVLMITTDKKFSKIAKLLERSKKKCKILIFDYYKFLYYSRPN